MKIEDIKLLFPWDEYRDNQEKTIIDILDAYNEGYEVVVLRAPVGFGKSPVGVTIGKIVASAFYSSPQKMLQNQLEKDFASIDFAIVKGRNNFRCQQSRETCDNGKCLLKKDKKKGKSANDDPSTCSVNQDSVCLYKAQRNAGLDAKICNTNFAYLMSVSKELFKPRELLIVDEAHSIPKWALDFAKTSININRSIYGKEIKIIEEIPTYTEFEDYLKWLGEIILPGLDRKKSELLQESGVESSAEMSVQEKKIQDYLDSLIEKIMNIIDDYEHNKEKWVWNINGIGKTKHIIFQPVTVGRFMDNLLWSRGDKKLLMSGTILVPNMFLEEVGLNTKKYKVISVPSSFHYHYNPVLYYPVGKMSKDFKEFTLPKIASKIEEIIEKHGEDKGIIHCNSYDIASYLYENIHKYKYRLILQNRDGREDSLKEFMASKNKIFISINMIEGLDLKNDLARYQILAKVPYPFIGDKRVYERLYERQEEDWFNLQAVEAICQSFGRAVRTDTDWATFYILDESFTSLWNRYKDYFTQEFINSYKYGIQLKEALESKIKFLPE